MLQLMLQLQLLFLLLLGYSWVTFAVIVTATVTVTDERSPLTSPQAASKSGQDSDDDFVTPRKTSEQSSGLECWNFFDRDTER